VCCWEETKPDPLHTLHHVQGAVVLSKLKSYVMLQAQFTYRSMQQVGPDSLQGTIRILSEGCVLKKGKKHHYMMVIGSSLQFHLVREDERCLPIWLPSSGRLKEAWLDPAVRDV
jgi:hypothetical protein